MPWKRRYDNAVRTLVIRLFVITVLVYAGVQFWYGRVEKRLQTQAPATKVVQPSREEVKTSSVSPTTSDDIAVVLTRNIFQAKKGEATAASGKPAESEIEQLAQTQLSLSLLGTVTGTQDDARAIIRDDKSKLEDLYRVGSEIQGALVKHITRGKVVLSVNGRDEVLVIRDREEKGGNGGSRMQRSTPITLGNSDEGMTKPTPKAVPRRRISFRSSAQTPPVAAPEEMTDTPEQEAPLNEVVEEPPPPSEEELLPPEPEHGPDLLEQEAEPAVEPPDEAAQQ